MQFEEQHGVSLPLRLLEYGYEVAPLPQEESSGGAAGSISNDARRQLQREVTPDR